MGAKSGDSFTMKVGVASDKDQCPSLEDFKEGRRIAAELAEREKPAKKKSQKAAIRRAKIKETAAEIEDLFKGLFK